MHVADPATDHCFGVREVCGLSVLYALLFLSVFISYRWMPLFLVALAPFAMAVCGARNGFAAIAIITTASAVMWFIGNQFFAVFTWAAVLALALLHASIIGVCAIALRWWYRATPLPLALLLPVTFVAGEFLRLSGSVGVPTGILGLPFYQQLWMIQIADLGGVYAVSFAVATVSGALADVLLGWRRRRVAWHAILSVLALWIFIAGYGWYRLSESQKTMRPGPMIGVVQPDVPMTAGIEHGFDMQLFLNQMLALSQQSAASEPAPQLIVWPEVMAMIPPLNADYLDAIGVREETLVASRQFEQGVREWTSRAGVSLLVGSYAFAKAKESGEFVLYNSAIRFDPNAGQFAQRQDKQRLFPLTETIPWQGTAVQAWLKRWVAARSSVASLTWYERGEARNVFELASPDGAGTPLHYAISMCVELCYAESCGTFLRKAGGGKATDFFVNMSNDGIFQRNRALVLHASMSAFRAVEARVGIARSSNTGVSGFVKPTGEMYGDVVNARGESWTGRGAPELPRIAALVNYRREHEAEIETDPAVAQHVKDEIAAIEKMREEAGVTGQSTQRVYVDLRQTFYSRTGDWFAWTLVGCTFVGLMGQAMSTIRRAVSH